MIRIYPEQLSERLNRSGLDSAYLITGNDPLLSLECVDTLRSFAKEQDFLEQLTIVVDESTSWNNITGYCQELSLFAQRKALVLRLSDSGINAVVAKQLLQLSQLVHSDLLLILQLPSLNKTQENSAWFRAFSSAIQISCMTPEGQSLMRWITQRAKQQKLQLDEPAVQLLSYYYEGNLLALAQTLDKFTLLFPKGLLTRLQIENHLEDVAHFVPYQWIDACLQGKDNRAHHILKQLKQYDTEALILLRTAQKELLLLLKLKAAQQNSNSNLKSAFDHFRIWQNRRELYSNTLQRLSFIQLQYPLTLLAQIEVKLKQTFSTSVWHDLELFSLLLCGKKTLLSFE